jgi:hypothetical protein
VTRQRAPLRNRAPLSPVFRRFSRPVPERFGRGGAWRGSRGLTVAVVAVATLAAAGCSSARHSSATPDTTGATTPGTSTPPTTTAAPAPAGFSPVSVSFVSADQGYVLGASACPNPPTTATGHAACSSVAATDDGGRSWRSLPAPPLALATGPAGTVEAGAVYHLRFGDHLNGWAYGPGLWATHDGGETWKASTLDGTVTDLASADGVTYALVSHCDSGPCGQGATLYRTDAGADAWQPVEGVALTPTGGQIALHARAVWITGAAGGPGQSLLSTSPDGVAWTTQPDPCGADAGLGGVAPVSTTDVFLLCGAGAGAGQEAKQVLHSIDAGHTAAAVPGSPSRSGLATAIAAASPQTIAVAAVSGASWVYRSADAGATWTTAIEQSDGGTGFTDLGFTTATQGVVIHGQLDAQSATGTQLLLTTDAGATWAAVTFS